MATIYKKKEIKNYYCESRKPNVSRTSEYDYVSTFSEHGFWKIFSVDYEIVIGQISNGQNDLKM